jgi:predicted TPR repeat methyltransferase
MLNSLLAQTGAWFNDLKFKIINFDIKPAKPVVAGLLEQARVASAAGNYALAENILQKTLIINKDNVCILLALSEVYLHLGKISKSIYILKRATRLSPTNSELYRLLADIYYYQGKYKASAYAVQRVLQLCPDETQLKHVIDSRLGNTTPKPSESYVVGLFDGYAESFEDNLVCMLEYKAHTELVNYLLRQQILPNNLDRVLDLGCGTGLLGQALLECCKISELVGVDLSANMLVQCRAKNIYHELRNEDLIQYLQKVASSIDLIVSTDVLIYLGDLDAVFAGCYKCLKPGGYLCVSVESMFFGNYKITSSGRYKHSLSYIKSLYKKYHFSKMNHQAIDLRKESGNMVKGYLVLLQK